jgi:hypothetical protein
MKASSLSDYCSKEIAAEERDWCALTCLQFLLNAETFDVYGTPPTEACVVAAPNAFPAVEGWGLERLGDLPLGEGVARVFRSRWMRRSSEYSTQEMPGMRQTIRLLYEGVAEVDDSDVVDGTADDAGDEGEVIDTFQPVLVPSEGLIEKIALRAKIDPLAVYGLIQDGKLRDKWRRPAAMLERLEEYATVIVLGLLGHRWPTETGGESGECGDADGVIPITEGAGELSLVARVREKLIRDFGVSKIRALEAEFTGLMGRSLSEWCGTEFFKRHVSQYKRRPIAWQLQSTVAEGGQRKDRRSRRKSPVFSCLFYYHKLDTDLLPKLRTQYVGPLRTSLQTELGGLEKMKERAADQDVRRFELEEKLEELKVFDARIEQVLAQGFGSPAVDKIAAMETMDKWTSRDGRGRAPETREALLAQERRYTPDLNDGVRVNIAPLQRAGLLAADVLAAKDVEKAIADRAEWRADERRRCREDKLDQPGWWPQKEET